jgi:hypothetical protein
MVEYDLRTSVSGINAITPAEYAVTTITGSTVDTNGFESLTFVTGIGTLTDGTYTVSIEDGDESDMSDASAVGSAYLLGTNPTIPLTQDDSVHLLGTNTKKRYARVMIDGAGVSSGGFFGSNAVLGHAKSKPTK